MDINEDGPVLRISIPPWGNVIALDSHDLKMNNLAYKQNPGDKSMSSKLTEEAIAANKIVSDLISQHPGALWLDEPKRLELLNIIAERFGFNQTIDQAYIAQECDSTI